MTLQEARQALSRIKAKLLPNDTVLTDADIEAMSDEDLARRYRDAALVGTATDQRRFLAALERRRAAKHPIVLRLREIEREKLSEG